MAFIQSAVLEKVGHNVPNVYIAIFSNFESELKRYFILLLTMLAPFSRRSLSV